jgi:hypothetical protein
MNNSQNKCAGCGVSLDYGETVPIPESVMTKISSPQSNEEALWDYSQYTPGYCSDCYERLINSSSSVKDEILGELSPDRKEYLDEIFDQLIGMDEDTVGAIVTYLEVTDIPLEAYEQVSRTIAGELVACVAASMLLDAENEVFLEYRDNPEKFIQAVWQRRKGDLR